MQIDCHKHIVIFVWWNLKKKLYLTRLIYCEVITEIILTLGVRKAKKKGGSVNLIRLNALTKTRTMKEYYKFKDKF